MIFDGEKLSNDKEPEEKDLTRTFIENALDAVVTMDEHGIITEWNRQAESIFGWDRREVIGKKKMSEVIIPERYRKAHQEGLDRFLAGGTGPILNKRTEFQALRRDGTEFPVELTVTPIRTKNRYRFNAFIRDITEQKKTESELERSNKELEQFAYVASHDLAEPLHTIIGFADRLKKYCEGVSDQTAHDYFDRMMKAALRMQKLIDDILVFSRATTRAKPFQRVDLNTLLQEVIIDLEARLRDSEGKIEVSNLPVVRGDRAQLRQLFQNLISNALKFRKKEIPPCVTVQSRIVGEHDAEISIQDNGIGFEEKFAKQIFQPFQRLHGWSEFDGSGIGLAICQKIIVRHGGDITAKSRVGEGSTFILKLPVTP